MTQLLELHLALPAALAARGHQGRMQVLRRVKVDDLVAPVEVLDDLPARSDEGIPKPEFVSQPGAAWRSRMQDGTWQVNSGHRDFLDVADRPPLKLRYLALLFAKEIVLRSHQDPRFEQPLEQIVEVAAFADRNLASRTGRGGRRAAAARDDEARPTTFGEQAPAER